MARNNRRTFLKSVGVTLGTTSVGSGLATSNEAGGIHSGTPTNQTSIPSQAEHTDIFSDNGPSPYPKLSWEMDLGGSMAAAVPVLANETLFLAVTTQNGPTSGKGYIAAYNPNTGAELWKQTGLPAPRTPTVHNGVLYITTLLYEDSTEEGLFAFDTATGELLWHRSEYLEWADPVLADGQLFTESNDGVYALDPATGEVNWKRDDVTGQIGYRDWQIHFVDGRIFYGDGTALNADDGSVVWHVSDEDFTLRQTGKKLVYGIRNRPKSSALEARSMKDGTMRWSARLQVEDLRSIQFTVTDKMVLSTETTGESSIITAYKPKSGKQTWQNTSTPPVIGDLVIANKRLLFRSGPHWARRITALNVKTGVQVWNHDVPAFLFSGPVIADGTAYVGGRYEPESNYSQSRALICAVDVRSGDREWSYLIDDLDQRTFWDGEPPAAGPPIIADGRVYTATYPAGSTLDYEYTQYANLAVFESTDQQPDADHRLPDEVEGGDSPPRPASKHLPISNKPIWNLVIR
jgi:outer membrane protein assembly factor BamB